MTQPPNGWGNQPSPPSPDNGWQGPQSGQQPPMSSDPFGQPNPPQGRGSQVRSGGGVPQQPGHAGPHQAGASWGPQPQWSGQQHWPGGQPPPQRGSEKTKWILGGLAVALAIALAVVITVVLVRPDNGGDSIPANAGANGAGSEFASANDTGPITIITEDPTCDAWNSIAREYTGTAASIKFDDRDDSVPATSWTPEQRAMYDSMKTALTKATDQTVNLTKITPRRSLRMVYEQFIAYGRTFAERIPAYVAEDDVLMTEVNGASASLTNICGAVTYRSAQAAAPRMSAVSAPADVAEPDKVGSPTRLLAAPNPVCSDWESMTTKVDSESDPWIAIDKSIPAQDWTPEQKKINDAVAQNNVGECRRVGTVGTKERGSAI